MKKPTNLVQLIEELRTTSQDMRQGPMTQGEQTHNCKKLDDIADKFEMLVTGHGTGEPDTQS